MRAIVGDPDPDSDVAEAGHFAGVSSNEAPAVAGCCRELQAQILEVLREHHLAEKLLLKRHHAELCSALERVCSAAESPQSALLAAEPLASLPFGEMDPAAAAPQPPTSAPNALETTPSKDSDLDEGEAKTDREGSQMPMPGADSGLRICAASSASIQFVDALMDDQEQEVKVELLRDRLEVLLQQARFDLFIGFLIVLSTVIMFVQLEVEAPSQGRGKFSQSAPHTAFEVMSHVFNAIFLLELLVRLYVKRLHFFYKAFNWIDALIVVLTLVDAYLLSALQSGNRQNISFMRLVRFIRVVRALRVIRTMNLFKELRVLLNTIAMSFMSLFWSMLILFIFMLMFSMFMCQMLSGFLLNDEIVDHGTKEWVFRHYGSSSRALWTVFEITFSGGWPSYARPVVEGVQAYYAIFFVIYITGVVFAMIRIISALFLKDTLSAAANDADMMVSEKMKEMKSFREKIQEMFKKADASGDGYLSEEELRRVMSYPKVRVWMSVIGLDVSDTEALFHILDDGDGRISYDGFIKGIMRLKGSSRSQDMIHIMQDCRRICQHCEATRITCEELASGLGTRQNQGSQELGPQRQRRGGRQPDPQQPRSGGREARRAAAARPQGTAAARGALRGLAAPRVQEL